MPQKDYLGGHAKYTNLDENIFLYVLEKYKIKNILENIIKL